MDNNCNYISESTTSEDSDQVSTQLGQRSATAPLMSLPQVCDSHDFNGGADVWCSNHVYVISSKISFRVRADRLHSRSPVTAKDTVGQWWNCWATNDHSCNKNIGGLGVVDVLACCSRQ